MDLAPRTVTRKPYCPEFHTSQTEGLLNMLDVEAVRRRANRVHVAIHDVQQAQKFAEIFKALRGTPAKLWGIPPDELDAALGMAAIVSYGRPFTSSNSDGIADRLLKPDELKLFDGQPQHRAEHELTMTLRDQVAAHSDWKHRFSLELVPDCRSDSVRDLVVFDTSLLLTNFHSFIDLARHVHLQLVSLLISLERKLSEDRRNDEPQLKT